MTTDFLAAWRLWLLVVVALLAVGYVVVLRWRQRATVRFTQIELLDQVAPRRPTWRRHVVAVLQLLGLAVAVVAIARPVDRNTERTQSEGRILVLFDVSLSMDADDVDPDRFTSAQEAARQFVEAVDTDVEVGLESFSGAVAVEVSPTLDRARVLEGIDDLALAEATAIGDALAVGTRLLVSAADESETSRADDVAPGVMVLLSDGETTVGIPTVDGAAQAAEAGIPVFTIAFGTEQGTIEDPVTGDILPVPVRTSELEEVAETTGGAAYAASTGDELANAYDEVRGSLGDTLGEEIEIVRELTWQWALAAFVLLASAWALSLLWLRGMV